MREKFTESLHCTSRAHCNACRTSEKFQQSIMASFEWDGECPFPEKERRRKSKPVRQSAAGIPCSSKHCRLGDRECDNYWGCRDTCKMASERITALSECPEELENEHHLILGETNAFDNR